MFFQLFALHIVYYSQLAIQSLVANEVERDTNIFEVFDVKSALVKFIFD